MLVIFVALAVPTRSAVDQTRVCLVAQAILHVAQDLGKERPWLYEPGSLSTAEAKALDPILRNQGFHKADGSARKQLLYVKFTEWQSVSRTRRKVKLYALFANLKDDVGHERYPTFFFNRKGSRWVFDRKASFYGPGE